MPLHAEEIVCPACELTIVFVNQNGEVMVEMVALDNPLNFDDLVVQEYTLTMELERVGDMYLPKHLPTKPQRADIVALPDGTLGVRFSNFVALVDVLKRPGLS